MMVTTALAPRRTFVDAAFHGQSLAYQIALLLAGSLLVAAMAQLAIPLPFTPVPLTGQTYAVLLIGAVLGSRRGALALLLYIFEGGVGLPFLAGATSGWPIGRPTGGYLLGFVVAAFVVGWLAERDWDRRFITAVAAMVIGQLVIYAAGLSWLAMYVGADMVLPMGLLPFLPGDVVKLLLAAATLPVAWEVLGRRRST
jgi:biotin transport system substrate-specific component